MEEKESTISGSLGNSDTDSPPAPVSSLQVLPQVMNFNRILERNIVSSTTATAITTTTASPGSGGGGTVSDSLGKKKRGRPRKYDADGNLRLPYPIVTAPPPGFTLSPSSPTEFNSSKRGKVKSPAGNWQLLASLGELFANTAGGDFTAHVVKVNTGEDVAGKILSLSEKGPRGICILSANGAVSNVTIRQPGSSGGILTFEGRFEILSLTGSFTFSDNGGTKNRTGGLSVSLAGPDGRVIGGALAGTLLAASPIQIVVGSFVPNAYKVQKRKSYREQHTVTASTVPVISSAMATVEEARSIFSQTKPDGENNMKPTSPFQGVTLGEASNNITDHKNIANIPAASIVSGWNNSSEPASIHRPSPDINVSVPSE
ncbi:AT-hook motif nuclear-localized protein 3 [Hibiscus syriacus]|uniref:AT-hook motif nuclear-localized protein n=1 Tax=Hibiscus syriacus TaxID=106335 RepID=A0A6A3B8M1_HIBSY|nr:AT-hook motif nuclear-localized protein 1-like [Hibiscus syriacus]KAE8713186.1 AT-hook motif nuclear-localized protein 3 [Hibiscus syriacus]